MRVHGQRLHRDIRLPRDRQKEFDITNDYLKLQEIRQWIDQKSVDIGRFASYTMFMQR